MAKGKEIHIKVDGDDPTEDTVAEAESATESETAPGDNTASVQSEDTPKPDAATSGQVDEESRLREKVAVLEDKLLRAAAEFDNYRKRTARQLDELTLAARDGLLVELLEIVDNFERALEHAENDDSVEAVRRGTEMIFKQMQALLSRYDVKPIDAVGEPFDPNLHEALMQVASDEYDEGIVAMEMTRGYTLGDRVLRHSKVAVSTGKPKNRNDHPHKNEKKKNH